MPRAGANDDADPEYGATATRSGRGRGRVRGRGRGAAATRGRGRGADPFVPEPVTPAPDDDNDDVVPMTLAESQDSLLPSFFDELGTARIEIEKYKGLVLKGRREVKTKAYTDKANAGLEKYQTQFTAASMLIAERREEIRRLALEATKKAKAGGKSLGKHATDFSDLEDEEDMSLDAVIDRMRSKADPSRMEDAEDEEDFSS